MDLLVKTMVAAVVVVAILFAVYYAMQNTLFQHITKDQAVSLITAYLLGAYPNAQVNVTNATISTYAGSWHIIFSIIINATSPCPSYFAYSFDYPQFGFVYRVENTYTKNCTIYGLSPEKPFIISSSPVAITRSYMLNASSIKAFIASYGFRNVTVASNFFNATTINAINYTRIWQVVYSSERANHSVIALLSQLNGNMLVTYNVTR